MDLKPFRDADVKGEMKGMDDEAAMKFIMAKWCGMCGKEGPITNKSNSMTPSWPSGFDYKAMSSVVEDITTKLEAKLSPLTAEITELKGQLSKQQKATETNEKNEILALAAKEGKVLTLSAGTIELTPVSALKEFLAALPKTSLPTKATMRVLQAEPPKTKLTRQDVAARFQQEIEAVYAGSTN